MCTRLWRGFAQLLLGVALGCGVLAQAPATITPTLADVPYGEHAQQKLDFYKAESASRAPLMFFIHGGGWMQGDKAKPDFLEHCLKAGTSVVSINYRHIPHVLAAGIYPPVKGCLEDAARALQFVRHKAREWNVDPQRIAACGGSAGGFSSLWLAFHPDMAQPGSTELVARESTRVVAAFTSVPQTSLDPKQMREWMPDLNYGPHAFSLPNFEEFLKQREKLMPWIREFSPYELASSDDPPVFLFYDSPVKLGQPSKDPVHSANFGEGLAEKLRKVGVEFEFKYQGGREVKHPDLFGFLKEKLGVQ